MSRFDSPVGKMPKPNLSKIKIQGKLPGKKVKGLGSDPVSLMKRFFLYKNRFGEGGGKIHGLDDLGSPEDIKKILSAKGQKSALGNIQELAAARRMGII